MTEDDPLESELSESAFVWCPYCGAEVEMLLDAGGGAVQEYVEDCEVCCRPWNVRVELLPGRGCEVRVVSQDEG